MRVAETAFRFPIVAWGVGLIALIVIPLLFVILAMTIILIPVVLFGFCFVIFGILFGWLDVGYGIGYQLYLRRKLNIQPFLITGLGVFLLGLVTSGFDWLLPCIGGFVVLFVIIPLGMGAVLLTRFGTQPYPIIYQ